MTEHTPPSWKIKDGHYPGFVEIEGPSFKISVVLVATNLTSEDYEKRMADVHLIAAAPETAAERDRLREANAELLSIAKRWSAPNGSAWSHEGYGAGRRTLQHDTAAAIAKAEGADNAA